MIRPIVAPNGQTYVVGGRRRSSKAAIAAVPRLADFIDYSKLPVPPPGGYDYSGQAQAALLDILANDSLGDCAEAGALHCQAVASDNAGTPLVITRDTAIQLYSGATGYDPADPSTDQGTDLVSLLNYLKSTGYPNGEKLAGYVSVDPTNWQEVCVAGYVLESLYGGLELPASCTNPMPSGSGFTWDGTDAPQPADGHCIMFYGATPTGLATDTWGLLGTCTPRFVGRYFAPLQGGELYGLLFQSAVARLTGKTPTGLDWPGMLAAFATLGGTTTP